MVVVAVARLPHRADQRAIGSFHVGKAFDHRTQSHQGRVGVEVGGALLKLDWLLFACRLASAQRYVGELAERARRDALETAVAQDRALKGELWRKPGAHL